MTKYLIIGASAGAVGAVEGIREIDPSGEIIVVSEERIVPYSRPAIGEYLSGKVDETSLSFGLPHFWELNHVKVELGKRAVTVNLQEKKVDLDDGQSLNYSKLLLAPGAKPIVPKIEGIERTEYTPSSISKMQMRLGEAPEDQPNHHRRWWLNRNCGS